MSYRNAVPLSSKAALPGASLGGLAVALTGSDVF
jgi:hypothetical protein